MAGQGRFPRPSVGKFTVLRPRRRVTFSVVHSRARLIACGRIARFLNLRNWTRAQASGEEFFNSIQQLSPQNEASDLLKSQAVQVTTDVGKLRWLLFDQTESSIIPSELIVTSLGWRSSS